ncbi:MAG: DUF924 family protein [Mesorhizobium sp.]|nr:DUF924 family protein [Mesorhizobium sp.]
MTVDTSDQAEIDAVTAFWREAGPDAWFRKDAAFDAAFHDRFLALHMRAARRELDHWNASTEGALALMILLDQMPRNCFRGTAHMFATDSLARHFSRAAREAGHDQAIEEQLRMFFYLPLMHSESLADQEEAVRLYEPLGAEGLKFAIIHRDIIARFGRFPHRNAAFGRATTPEEKAFLDEGGFAG